MAPQLLFDISGLDLDTVIVGVDGIEAVNPHRGIMRLLDGIVHANEDYTEGIAFKDIRDDEFWVPGHIPGRPLFPGVLMLEAAAQLASWVSLQQLKADFMGFVGLDNVKFRGQVVPGDRLYIMVKQIETRRRRCVCDSQGVLDGKLVFEARVTGMVM